MTSAVHFLADLLDRAAHRMRKLAVILEHAGSTMILHDSMRPAANAWDDEACIAWKRANL